MTEFKSVITNEVDLVTALTEGEFAPVRLDETAH